MKPTKEPLSSKTKIAPKPGRNKKIYSRRGAGPGRKASGNEGG